MAGDAQAPALVGGGYEAKEQLTTSGVERGEAKLVKEDEVGPQQVVDEPADGVIGEAPVEVCRSRMTIGGPEHRG